MSALIRRLSEETGLNEFALRRIMLTAPARYKTYAVDKRSGGKRLISQPAREVKFVQRALMKVLLDHLPVHPAATAYRAGLSIADNATPHRGDGPILKLDLKEFFPSIRVQDWYSYCREAGCLHDEDDIRLSGALLFHRAKASRVYRLAIGAPSSPILSNILMFKFDEAVLRNIESEFVTYTRYADDMTFSAKRLGFLSGVLRGVARSVREVQYPKLEINPDKTTLVTTKNKRTVTGLTLSDDGRITIGRQRKREISAAVDYYRNKKLDLDQIERLAGMLAFANAVEPDFLEKLKVRYGYEVIIKIQHVVPRKKYVPRKIIQQFE